jgi:hypothetical protein
LSPKNKKSAAFGALFRKFDKAEKAGQGMPKNNSYALDSAARPMSCTVEHY